MAMAPIPATAPAAAPAAAPDAASVLPPAMAMAAETNPSVTFPLATIAVGSAAVLPSADLSLMAADRPATIDPSHPLVRTSSTSKLNAQAPEFVPKTIMQPSGAPPYFPTLPAGPLMHPTPSPFAVPLSQQQPAPLPSPILGRSPEGLTLFAPPGSEQVEAQIQFVTASSTASVKPVVTEELKSKIVKQVEFYFSEINLPTDNYLMRFVKKDPEGFVPIPVVASFRKIKNLAKNHGVVAAALRHSTMLVVSEDGKKVRRAQPLPDIDLEEVQLRTVVAENLPDDHSIDDMEQLFGKIGNVKMVRICQPEAANGALQTAAKHPKADMVVSNKLHALVEYETVEQAERAVAELTDERNWRSGLRVRLLLRRTFQSKYGYQQPPLPKARKTAGDCVVGDGSSGGEEDDAAVEKCWDESGQLPNRSDETLPMDIGDAARRGKGRGVRGRGRGRCQHVLHHTATGIRGYPLGTSPQNCSPILTDVARAPPGPRMPDGTRGFSVGRGKFINSAN